MQLAYIILLRFTGPFITITQLAGIFKGNGFNRDHISMNEISREGKLAVIASEDQLFPDHNGFDIKSIQKALAYNKKNLEGLGVHQPLVSKLQKMFFFGREEAG